MSQASRRESLGGGIFLAAAGKRRLGERAGPRSVVANHQQRDAAVVAQALRPQQRILGVVELRVGLACPVTRRNRPRTRLAETWAALEEATEAFDRATRA